MKESRVQLMVGKMCYVDQNIKLSDGDLEQLKNSNIKVEYISLKNNMLDYSKIELILIHSFLADETLLKMKNCKYIGIRAHNTDYVNQTLAAEKGIPVVGLANQYGINAVAEHTLMLILAVAKNILNSHQNTIRGGWRNGLGLNIELENKTLGIIGYGGIGKRVAELAKAFGMKVLVAGKPTHLKENELPLAEVLKNSDIISLHLPATKENQGYIDEVKLALMKKGTILINTARGAVLDYDAVEKALRNNQLFGVGLDVYPDEPVFKSELFQCPNVVCTPHIAYLTQESVAKMNQELIGNFLNFLHLI